MDDETKQDDESGKVAETTETQETTTEETTPTLEELTKQVAELTKLDETRKNEIAGLNRANTDGATKYQELLKSTETDKQTQEREANEKQAAYEKDQTDFLTSKAEFAKKENDFNVRVKALELGFTADDIEALGFSSVESVEKYKTFLDTKLSASKEMQTTKIESALSGARTSYNTEGKTSQGFPSAIDKALNKNRG